MADHELVANDTEPSWEGYLDYVDAPAIVGGAPNPDLPALPDGVTLTWVQKLTTAPGTVVIGAVEVVNAATRHVRHRFTTAETAVPGDWSFSVQIDYLGDPARRQTHPVGAPLTLKVWPDLGGPT